MPHVGQSEFLDGLVEKVYEFGDGKVKECLGGIYEFLEKKKLASLAELEKTQPKKEVKTEVTKPRMSRLTGSSSSLIMARRVFSPPDSTFTFLSEAWKKHSPKKRSKPK